MSPKIMPFPRWLVVLVVIASTWDNVKAMPSSKHCSLDTFASVPEESWFSPRHHVEEIDSFLETWGGWELGSLIG